jgi:hypothetical protein
MGTAYNANIVTDGLELCLDAANPRSYPGSGSTWYDLSGNSRNFTLYNSSYYSFSKNNAGYIDLNRTMPPTTETGGYAIHTATGALTSANYMFNDHTTEILVRFDDIDATNYNTTETINALLVYRGYHCLFYANTSDVYYNIWAINGSFSSQSTPYGIAPQENNWTHYAATRNGNTITLYKNGEMITSNSITTTAVLTNVSNDIVIGRAAPHSQGYSWAADIKVSLVRMYTTALDSDQIAQNFNATRGRYGI